MGYRYLSAVDMGTNSFHMIIVRASNDGSFKVIDREKDLIRLGSHEGEGLSLITRAEMELALKSLKKFKALADFYNAPLRAVATSAVREAKNKDEFIKLVKDNTGIKIEVIDGHREAKLIYLGIQYAVPVSDKRVLCFDIGGGSTEFILGDKGNTVFAESVKIGAVRLTKNFFPDFKINPQAVIDCEKYIEKSMLANKNIKFDENYDLAIGSSGTILAAAGLVYSKKTQKIKKKINKFTFSRDELFSITEDVLSKKTVNARLKLIGIEEKRADIIPAGLLILRKIFSLFNLPSMIVSENALRSGIIIESLERL